MKTQVLIIEDQPDNLELITYLLNYHGYSTIQAKNGKEGLEQLQKLIPDLIISDIQLPYVTGYEIAKFAKADEKLKKVPIIAITSFSMIGDREKILIAGFDGYISKPFDPMTFIDCLEKYLPQDKRMSKKIEKSIGE